jgi:hypothetical protein
MACHSPDRLGRALTGLDLLGDVGAAFPSEGLHFGAERLFLGGELEIHLDSSAN